MRRQWWRTVSLCAAVGLAVVVAIYLVGLNPTGFRLEEMHTGVLMFLCPPLIMTMAITNQSRSEVMQIYGMIGIVNAGLYAILGLFIATIRGQIARKRNVK